jgi:hypothetical protein
MARLFSQGPLWKRCSRRSKLFSFLLRRAKNARQTKSGNFFGVDLSRNHALVVRVWNYFVPGASKKDARTVDPVLGAIENRKSGG